MMTPNRLVKLDRHWQNKYKGANVDSYLAIMDVVVVFEFIGSGSCDQFSWVRIKSVTITDYYISFNIGRDEYGTYLNRFRYKIKVNHREQRQLLAGDFNA